MEMPHRSESKKNTDESEQDIKRLNEPGSAPMHDAEDDDNKDARIDVADFAAYLDRIKESGPDQKEGAGLDGAGAVCTERVIEVTFDDGDADVGHADDVGCNGGDCGAAVENANANFGGDCVSAETENYVHEGSSETERLSETPRQDKHNTYDYGEVSGAALIGGDGIAYCGSGDRNGGVGYSGVARGVEGVGGADSYGHGSGCIGGNAIPFDATVDSNGGAGYGDGVAAGGRLTIDGSGDDGSDSSVNNGHIHPYLQQPGENNESDCCDKLLSYRCCRSCRRRRYRYRVQRKEQNRRQRRDDNYGDDIDAGVDGFFWWFLCCYNGSGGEGGGGGGGNDNGINWCCDCSDCGKGCHLPSCDNCCPSIDDCCGCCGGCDCDGCCDGCGDCDCGDCGDCDCGDCGECDFD